MRAACQAVAVLWGFAEDTQTDRADEPDIHDAAVAEAGSAEVDVDAGWEDKVFAGALVREKGHH